MDDELSDLIGLVYEATLDAQLWPEVLTGLADVAGAHLPMMGVYDLATDRVSLLAPRTDPDHLRLLEYWVPQASYLSFSTRVVSNAAGRPAGDVFTMQSVVPVEEFVRTDFYNEWWQLQGIGTAGLITGVLVDGSTVLGAAVHKRKPRHHDAFGRHEVARFRTAMSHIVRAIRVQRALRLRDFRQDAVTVALDRRQHGIVMVDEAAHILFANRFAKGLLDEGDGLRPCEGRLSTAADSDRLEALVASCAEGARTPHGPGGSLMIQRGGIRSPLHILVAPLRMAGTMADVSWLGLRRPAAILTITDPDAEAERCRRALQRRFRLTPAESAFALEIAKGDGRDAAAARRGISVSTAHAHLASIFEKTGAHRQAELARIVLDCRSDACNDDGVGRRKPLSECDPSWA
jgi:DNA-binding CsgD family transcriptional regulator